MKKTLALLLTAVMLVAALALAVSADYTFSTPTTDFDVMTASEISFEYNGQTSATAFPRGGGTLECLIDGENAAEVTNHDQAGIVLVCNDFIKPDYEEDMAMADQPADAIPSFSFALKYDEVVTFDAVYLSLFYQMKDCVSAPGEHKVIVEISDDGKVWVPVGEDGAFYYRENQPEYTGEVDPVVDEIVVPLGEEVESQYVRLTFKFKQLSEADPYWDYYTNVYEWCGFTELAVALYEGGDEPTVMDESYANAPALELSGMWITEDDEGMTTIINFYELEGEDVLCMSAYDSADFAENGMLAEAVIELEMFYTAGVDHVVADLMGESVIFYFEIEDDLLYYSDGAGSEMYLEAYVPDEEPGESSEEASSEEESSAAVSEEESEEESSEAAVSEEESKAVSTESKPAATSSAASTSAPADDDAGFPVWAIVLIVVAVVAVVVVVILVVRKKK